MWGDEPDGASAAGKPSLRDRLSEWWQAATGPVYQTHHASLREAWLQRFLTWAPVLAVAAAGGAALAVYLLAGWRAADLADKAVANAGAGQLRLAMVQVESARRLRGGDGRVLLAAAVVATRAGHPGASAAWDRVPSTLQLTTEERGLKAAAVLRHAPAAAVAVHAEDLRTQGFPAEAESLLAASAEKEGNLDRAIGHARAAVAGDPSPKVRLALARLLTRRHAGAGGGLQPSDEAALAEAAGLIDGLRGTPLEREALGLGLAVPALAPAQRLDWARAVLRRREASDPALPAAARVVTAAGELTPAEGRALLEEVMHGAAAPPRLALAGLLTEWGMPEAALGWVGEEEARLDTAAFATRADALAAAGRWEELLAAATAATDPLRLAARAEASVRLGRPGLARNAAAEALVASLGDGSSARICARLDAFGLSATVDEELLEACGEPVRAAAAFALARDRFSRQGRESLLEQAWQAAAAAAPSAPTVEDFRRRRALLAGERVDPAATREAWQAAPADPDLLTTHALALYRDGRPEEAWALFGERTVFFRDLTPGQQAVVALVAATAGDPATGRRAATSIDRRNLTDDELALLAPALTGTPDKR